MLTTKTDFNFFQKECRQLINTWGLTDWNIYFSHQLLGDCLGSIVTNARTRMATIFLASDWEDHVTTEKTIKEVAKHEVLHLLFADLRTCAFDRHATEGDIYKAEEAVVSRLMKII